MHIVVLTINNESLHGTNFQNMLQHISIDLHIHISLFQVEKKNSENLHRISTIILWIVICHVLFYVLLSIDFVYSSLLRRKRYIFAARKATLLNNICHIIEKNTNYLTILMQNMLKYNCTKRQGQKISASMMETHLFCLFQIQTQKRIQEGQSGFETFKFGFHHGCSSF